MRGLIRGILIGGGVVLIIVLAVLVIRPGSISLSGSSTASGNLTSCGGGVYVQSGQSCPGQATPGQTVIVQTTQPSGTTPVSGVNVSVVTTAGSPCPTNDFSLKVGTTCQYSGGQLLICEGDMSFPAVHFTHDTDQTTGQVFELDQASLIDGTDNGGSCHYSPPWQEQASIDSVKHGCGGGCAKVLVYKDGNFVKTV